MNRIWMNYGLIRDEKKHRVLLKKKKKNSIIDKSFEQ